MCSETCELSFELVLLGVQACPAIPSKLSEVGVWGLDSSTCERSLSGWSVLPVIPPATRCKITCKATCQNLVREVSACFGELLLEGRGNNHIVVHLVCYHADTVRDRTPLDPYCYAEQASENLYIHEV